MKTNKYIFSVMGFLTGTVFGISIICFMSFTNSQASPGQASSLISITTTQAHTYFTNYMANAVPYNQVIKGLNIDKAALTAMNSISVENPALAGFRIYFGKDGNGKNIGIVVGVDGSGLDDVKSSVINTDSPKTSPCPPICDVNSPIIFGN